MKLCKNCGLKFDGLQSNCLFCNNHLEDINNEISSTFSNAKPKRYYIDRIKKIILFSLIVLVVISIFLESYLFSDQHYWLLTFFSSVYVYFVCSVSLDLTKGLVAKFMNISFLTMLESLGVFYFFNEFNMPHFYFSYVYPSIILLTFIAEIIILFITKGKKLHDQLIYVILTILWGLTPAFGLIFNFVNPTYLSSICVAISSLIALGFIFFADKDTKDELIRRLHI